MRISITPLLALAAATVMAVPLLGCATPEELAAAEARRQQSKQTQTGTNIAKRDHGNTRVTGASGKDNVDDTMKDAIRLPDRAVMNPGGG